MSRMITVEQTINASPERVFEAFVTPDILRRWHHASDDWTTPHASVDLRVGGQLVIGYQGCDPADKFDLIANFTEIDPPRTLAYRLDDGRQVRVDITGLENGATQVVQQFEAESDNPDFVQRRGWSAQLANLKNYLES